LHKFGYRRCHAEEPEERVFLSRAVLSIAHTPRGQGQGPGPRVLDLETATRRSASSWAFDLIVGIRRLPRTHHGRTWLKVEFLSTPRPALGPEPYIFINMCGSEWKFQGSDWTWPCCSRGNSALKVHVLMYWQTTEEAITRRQSPLTFQVSRFINVDNALLAG